LLLQWEGWPSTWATWECLHCINIPSWLYCWLRITNIFCLCHWCTLRTSCNLRRENATGCQGPPFPVLHHSTHKPACVPLGLYRTWPITHTLCITCRVGGRAKASKNKIPKSISPFSPTCSGTAPPLPLPRVTPVTPISATGSWHTHIILTTKDPNSTV
jgi:hypothetical protein